ncbi:formate dehydrogenase (NADP) alpha subunit [Desulfofundulus thermosubterraneus DSM 16057]|nr:formate dehydrogenase (NADP) alpha subunit [Desulfofundulus thermosubterraneus DSM 16057]
MAEVTLTIDGRQVTVPAGTTVLDAARSAGIFIPTLCHDPELTPWGGCRLCVVEIEGMRNLPASCVTTATNGMVVHTASPAVVEARKTIIELLLANHPEDCLTCGRNGDCRLQDYAYLYGVREAGFVGERHHYPLEEDNPFIIRDLNKCILCGKCVRACAEIQGKNVVDFAYRGFNTKITPAMDTSLSGSDCVFCGNCVAVCPVGALQEKGLRAAARTWEVKKVRTTCPYCGTGCTFDLNVKDGRVVGVTSCDGEVNGRALCVKGRFGYGFIHHPDRLTKPLIKRSGVFEEASWEEAINLVAEKLGSIKKEYGSAALGVLSSARCTNEENYLMSKFTRVVLGTNNIDHCARL